MNKMSVRSARAMALAVLCFAGCHAPPTVHNVAADAKGPYSGSVVAGDFVFLSGKIGEGGKAFEHEVNTAIDAMKAELARASLDLADLVSVTVYLTDMELYGQLNSVWNFRIPEPRPARACVAVAALPADARVEIVGIARIRDR